MVRIILLLTLVMLSSAVKADNQHLYEELDATIAKRGQYIEAKENQIAFLKKKLRTERDSSAMLKVVEDLYSEYHVYQFDSAMVYANRGLTLSQRLGNRYYTDLFTVYVAQIMAIGGLYSEAMAYLDNFKPAEADKRLLFKYYFTYFNIYAYWSDYCGDTTFTPHYRQKANEYLREAMQHANPQDPDYQYYKGEQMVYVTANSKQAREHYLRILDTTEETSRIYAMSAFALAGNYKVDNQMEKYEEYLIRSALSDLKCCTKENMSMQVLAEYLFSLSDQHIERAERYINVSMEDAKFYNNRLRILEISRTLPQIMLHYQETVKTQNRALRYSLLFISLLVVAMLWAIWLIYRKNRLLALGRRELADSNMQLTEANRQLAVSNEQQGILNQKLVDTNKRREGLASIYIDLCAQYIDKLNKYQTLVKRKIKANQAQELLQTISSTRISEEDAATFLTRFDKAFLELYPTFIDEFNELLLPEGRILQKTPGTLTTELRTFALIRLGVKKTTDIADLLFLSSQTIYNCRSLVKNKAINKDTFDDDVLQLCTVIK